MMNEIIKKIQKYLLSFLRNEIIIADESYFIIQTVNEYRDLLFKGSFDLFFKSLYSAHIIRYTLAIVKLFEKPNKRYETISVPFVLNYIDKNSSNLKIQERPNLEKQYSILGYNRASLGLLSDEEFVVHIITHFKDNLPSVDYNGDIVLSRTFDVLKTFRDKKYAHNEDFDMSFLPGASLEESFNLLLFAKQFVSLFSLAYLNLFQSYDGKEFLFTLDAMITKTSFQKLLKKVDIVK